MTGVGNQDVRPTTFLMHDASEIAGIVVPRGFWLTTETLDSTKRCVLCNENQTREEREKCEMVVLGCQLS